MSEYPNSGNWHQSSNASPQSPSDHGERATTSPYDYPYQCGICYDKVTACVEELDRHIEEHRNELSRRLEQRNQLTVGQNSHHEHHPHTAYQGPSSVPSNYFSSNAQMPPSTPTNKYDFEEQRFQLRDTRAVQFPAEYRAQEIYQQQPQQGPSGSIGHTTESWVRTGPTSSTQQEYFPPKAKRMKSSRQSFDSTRDELCHESEGQPVAATVLPSGEIALNHGHDEVSYHEMQPAKETLSTSPEKAEEKSPIQEYGQQLETNCPTADDRRTDENSLEDLQEPKKEEVEEPGERLGESQPEEATEFKTTEASPEQRQENDPQSELNTQIETVPEAAKNESNTDDDAELESFRMKVEGKEETHEPEGRRRTRRSYRFNQKDFARK